MIVHTHDMAYPAQLCPLQFSFKAVELALSWTSSWECCLVSIFQ